MAPLYIGIGFLYTHFLWCGTDRIYAPKRFERLTKQHLVSKIEIVNTLIQIEIQRQQLIKKTKLTHNDLLRLAINGPKSDVEITIYNMEQRLNQLVFEFEAS